MSHCARAHTYLVESFEGSPDEGSLAGARDRLRSACAELRASGRAVEYLGALVVPQDELVLHLFRSSEADGVRDACRQAAISVERIVESMAVGAQTHGTLVVPAQPGGVRPGETPPQRG